MQDAFVAALIEIARADRGVMLLTGGLGFGVLTGFAREFPKQYLNVGGAEQNMTGLAAGMALEGKTVLDWLGRRGRGRFIQSGLMSALQDTDYGGRFGEGRRSNQEEQGLIGT